MRRENAVLRTDSSFAPRALAAGIALVAAGAAGAAPPDTPGALRASAYSGTAGGIAWQRSSDPDGTVVGYEIRRDGRTLDVRDALSYVDEGLAPGTRYAYRVVAIDDDGERSAASEVMLTTRGGPAGDAAPDDDRPSAPTGLRAEVYSDSAFELFWDRADRRARYEVRADGEVVADRPFGVASAFLSVEPGRVATYRLVAIDERGARSEPVAVRVDLGNRTVAFPDAGGPDPDGPSTGGAPAIERVEVYSATAAELFWARPATGSVTVDVLRDGRQIGTTDGTSFFDDTREPGARHDYALALADGSSVEGPPADGDSVIATRPAEALIADAFGVFTGERYGAEILSLVATPLVGAISERDALLGTVCKNGGGVSIEVIAESSLTLSTRRAFDDCLLGARVFDGGSREVTSFGGRLVASGIDIRASDGDGATETFEGDVDYWFAGIRGGSPRREYGIRNARYERIVGGERSALEEAGWLFGDVTPFVHELEGGYVETSPETGGRALRVRVTEPLVGGVNALESASFFDRPGEFVFFVDGTLELVAEGGDSIVVDAGNGDPATFGLVVRVDGQAVRSETLPWAGLADSTGLELGLLSR